MTLDLITPASPAGYLTSEGANRERAFLTSVFPILPTCEPGSGKQHPGSRNCPLPVSAVRMENLWKHGVPSAPLDHVLAAHTPMQGAGLAAPTPDCAHPAFLLVCVFLSPDRKIPVSAGKPLHYHSSWCAVSWAPPGAG